MDREKVLETIIKIISKMTDEEVKAESDLVDDLSISSLDLILITTKIEAEFNMKIDINEISDAVTVLDLCEVVIAKQ